MPELEGTATHANLMAAFAREAQANRRYLWFAQAAEVEGLPEVAGLFRSVAESETAHAYDLLDLLTPAGDPVTGWPMGDTADNLRAALAGETEECTHLYTDYAHTARAEGFGEIADWLDVLARAEQTQVERFTQALRELE